jgi:serine/threonine protein kinase/formylglycine-generating enzyme required for sulfatase activity
MSGDTASRFDILTLPEAEVIDAACDRFETGWRAGDWPCIEGYLDAVAEPCRQILLIELVKLELELRMAVGETPTSREYRRRFPGQDEAIDEVFRAVQGANLPLSTEHDKSLLVEGDAPNPNGSTLSFGPEALEDPLELDAALGRQLGDYLIVERLGSGGMGVVYKAHQRSARRFVALKLIRADWWGDSTQLSTKESEIRFKNEAQATAQLEHENIVSVYDVGHVSGLLYFSMRLIKGRSLNQILLSDGPLPPRRAAYYVEAIARAVQYAHDNRVLHRDLKPGNIMIDETDRPILIDLGLAKSLEATEFTTFTGRVLGTVGYMSPEQARGDKEIGFATDVYGLGATLFALLTGRAPFTGAAAVGVMRKVIDEEPAWPREFDKAVGKELKAICLKCLEKDSKERIPSAGELAAELKKYLNYEPCKYSLPGPGARLAKWVKRQPWRAAAASIAVLASLAVGLAGAWNVHFSREVTSVFLRDLQRVPLADLPEKIQQMASYRAWVVPKLQELLPAQAADSEMRTRVLLALLPSDPAKGDELAARLLRCPFEEHQVIREALRSRWSEFDSKMHRVIADPQSERNQWVRAATALIALEGPDNLAANAWTPLRLAPDPSRRVKLLDWLVQSKVDPNVLAARLDLEPDQSIRRQLIQALGGLGEGHPPAGTSQSLPVRLMGLYRSDTDPGVHSSIAYLLRRWGMEGEVARLDQELARQKRGGRQWYVNPVGITMAVIDVPEAERAKSPESGQLPARFAIAIIETPLALFERFDPEYAARWKKVWGDQVPDPDAPASAINYFDAASFCNDLSAREQIPQEEWCYRPGRVDGVMVLKPDYLKLRGYRLPTICEWVFAARAGTVTDRFFGQDTAASDSYCWHRLNAKTHPRSTGRLRPNDFGLFDVIGNLAEWCYNPNAPVYEFCAACPPNGPAGPCEVHYQARRGGTFMQLSREQGVVSRDSRQDFDLAHPHFRWPNTGFRVVKNEP